MLCCDPSLKDIKWAGTQRGSHLHRPAACTRWLYSAFVCHSPRFFPPCLSAQKDIWSFTSFAGYDQLLWDLQSRSIWYDWHILQKDECLKDPTRRPDASPSTDKWILYMKVRAANIFAYSKVLASGTTIFFISIATASIFNRKLKTNFKNHF